VPELPRRIKGVAGWATLRGLTMVVLAAVAVALAARGTAAYLLLIPFVLALGYVLFVIAGKVGRLSSFGRILGLLTFGVLAPLGVLLGVLLLSFGLVGVLVIVVALGDAAAAFALYDDPDAFTEDRPSAFEIDRRAREPDPSVPGVPGEERED
jgi:hypothetical protein